MLNIKDIDLNLLVVFQEIFQERHISKVAHHLNLSQSAVSNALARLRKTFDDALFVRTSKGMQPTPLAQQLAEPISTALKNIARALNQYEHFDVKTSQRHFTIAMTDIGEMYFMPLLIAYCKQHAPHIKITSVRAHNVNLMQEMETGHIDVAVGAFDALSGALFQRRLFKQNYVTMFREGHPSCREGITMRQFLAEDHLLVSSKESPYDKINLSLEKAGIAASAHYTVPHFSSVPYIICSTDLLVTVPEKLALSAKMAFNLQYTKPPLRLPSLQTNVFWHRRFAQDEGNMWLRASLVDLFSS